MDPRDMPAPAVASSEAALRKPEGWVAPAVRLQRIVRVLARHGLAEVGSWLLQPSSLLRLGDATRLGERLARVLADLGVTYIKLGQLLATREDLLPPEVVGPLKRLGHAVPPMAPTDALAVLREGLGGEARRLAWFDPVPLAAASIGQVHRARLVGGDEVVVKLQRRGLRRQIEADLQMLRFIAQLLARANAEVARARPVELIEAFGRSLLGELDFRREAASAVQLGALLDGAREVRVPAVYPELARETVLVLEYVRGRRVADLSAEEQARLHPRLLRAFVRQVLDHGVFHADPHPGNFLVEPDGRLVLLDLGAVETLERPLRRELKRLVQALVLSRPRALADAVLTLSPDGPPAALDRPRLERDLTLIAGELAASSDAGRLIGHLFALSFQHQLRLPAALVALVRALALVDGVLRSLAPGRPILADLRRELFYALGRRIERAVRAVIGYPLGLLARLLRRRAA
jgi:ubiquinone biosynthesis protein